MWHRLQSVIPALTSQTEVYATLLTNSFINHPPQHRKTIEPVAGLQDNLESRLDMPLVERASTAHRGLIRERADRFQPALNCHQSEFFDEIVRVNRIQTEAQPLFKQKQTVSSNFRQGRRLRLPVHQQ